MAETVGILIRDFPPDLKARLVADAEAQETNLSEVAVAILADSYGVAYEPKGSRSTGVKDSAEVYLRAPDALRRKLRVRSATTGRPIRTLVLEVLAPHYGLEPPPQPRRGPRRTKTTTAA